MSFTKNQKWLTIQAGATILAGIGGVVYANSKGKKGLALKVGYYFLFAAAVAIPASIVRAVISDKSWDEDPEKVNESQVISGLIQNCNDGYSTLKPNGCATHGGVRSLGYEPQKEEVVVVDNGGDGLPSDYCMYYPEEDVCQFDV
jgi:hypothetical protein